MGDIILARHAENQYSASGIANGDPAVPVHLTETGRRQAEALGDSLAGTEIDLCVTSRFIRTRETADEALRGRSVPRIVDSRLDDISYGRFEGESLDLYHDWARGHDMADIVPGGVESRLDVVARCLGAALDLINRDAGAAPGRIHSAEQATILVVTHEMIITYLFNGVRHEEPSPQAEKVPYATPLRLSLPEMRRACEWLTRWLNARRSMQGAP